jgi:hypothetical protein
LFSRIENGRSTGHFNSVSVDSEGYPFTHSGLQKLLGTTTPSSLVSFG